MKKTLYAVLALVALATIGLAAFAQDDPPEVPSDPVMTAWIKAYSANPLGWNAAWFEIVNKEASLTFEQKWAGAMSLARLEAKHGARGLHAMWLEAPLVLKVSMKSTTKKILADARDALAAQKAAADAELTLMDETP